MRIIMFCKVIWNFLKAWVCQHDSHFENKVYLFEESITMSITVIYKFSFSHFFLLILFNLWLLILILTICTHQGRHEFDLLLVFIKSSSYFCGTLFCVVVFFVRTSCSLFYHWCHGYTLQYLLFCERENILCWLNHV